MLRSFQKDFLSYLINKYPLEKRTWSNSFAGLVKEFGSFDEYNNKAGVSFNGTWVMVTLLCMEANLKPRPNVD